MANSLVSSVQFLRSDASDPPVTVIREIRVGLDRWTEFEKLMSLVIDEAMRQPGFLGATVVRPRFPGDAYRFIYKFDRRSHLETWHQSESRARLVAPVTALVESDRFDEYPGLETWFELPGQPNSPSPPKWKTTLMGWAGIYVIVLIVAYAMEAVNFEAPIPVRALVLTAIVVPTFAYLVAPCLGRWLHGWLHAGTERALLRQPTENKKGD